jgi:dihydroorotate dehydrogenase
MSLVPYSLARKLLFSLNPEAAHSVTMATIAMAQRTPLQYAYCSGRIHDPVELAGLRFANRVGLAAGLDKNARCIDGLGAMGFGFVEVGTVTPRPQIGNPKPRMFRLPKAHALINRLGFNNAGVDAFVANVTRSNLRRQKNPDLVLGLNIGKNSATPMERAIDDYLICLDAVYPHADYVAVNISSPNTNNLRDLQNPDSLDTLLGALSERRAKLSTLASFIDSKGRKGPRRVPMFLKIAPDLDGNQIKAIAIALLRHGMDGVIATNTTLSREAVLGLTHAKEAGGLSGAPVLEMSNNVIKQLRAAMGPRFPIIGVGGIMSGADAVSKIRAGADVVQLYTGLIYKGPDLVREAAMAIKTMQGKPKNSSWSERL